MKFFLLIEQYPTISRSLNYFYRDLGKLYNYLDAKPIILFLEIKQYNIKICIKICKLNHTQKREHDVTDFFQRMKDVKPGRFVSGVK